MAKDRSMLREGSGALDTRADLPKAKASDGPPLGPEQCRMARAALRMTVDELAERAGVSHATISRLENDHPCAPADDALVSHNHSMHRLELPDTDFSRKPNNYH